MTNDQSSDSEYYTTTRLGEKGQITIPKEFRDRLELGPGAPIAVVRVGNALMLFPERDRFAEFCTRLTELISQGELPDAEFFADLPLIVRNQERIIANQERILANQETIIAK
jgi:AbrB family looped-hinge helix DNA binding protein